MTQPPRDGARPEPPKRPARTTRDPYGLLPSGVPIAAVLSVVALLVIGIVTLNLTNGELPFSPGGGAAPQGTDDVPARTATPSNEVIVATPPPDTGITVPGTLVYAKAGNIWVQTGDQATQITAPGKGVNDSMPSFSEDGQSVYFVRTRKADGKWSIDGELKDYQLDVPTLMRVNLADGKADKLLDGLVDPAGPFKWNGFIREPVVSPDGRYVAMATDLPDPTKSDVTLKLYDLRTKKIDDLKLDQVAPLGHQDPAWKPDGTRLLYVLNDRDGAKGTPRIYGWNPDTGNARAVTGSRLPLSRVVAGRPVHRRDQDQRVRDGRRDPEREHRRGARAADRRRQQLGADVVAARGPGRLPPRRRPGHRPPDGAAGGNRAVVDGQGDARPHDRGRPRRRVAPRLVRARRRPPDAAPRRTGRVAVAVVTSYLDRLGARTAATGSVLCVGIDPDPAALPPGFPATLDGVERFARLIIEAALPVAAAVKPNLAFFEALGSAGIAALERLRLAVPADVPFIADAKRGDIGSTAERQAVALFDVLGADAVTVSPYLGEEAIAPLLARTDRFAYVLCRTSNPGAAEVQGLEVGDGTPAPGRNRCGRASPGWRPRGDPAAPWGSWSGRRPPRSWPPCAASRRGSPSWSRASGRRAARSRPCSRRARPRRRRRRAFPAAACSSTSPGGSPGRPSTRPRTGPRAIPASASRGPPPSGPNDSLCYPDALPRRPVPHGITKRSIHEMPFNIGPGELIIVLIIALIVVGPGKLPDVGAALGKSIKEFRKAATDVKESTSLDTAPAAASAAPTAATTANAVTAAPVAAPVAAAIASDSTAEAVATPAPAEAAATPAPAETAPDAPVPAAPPSPEETASAATSDEQAAHTA